MKRMCFIKSEVEGEIYAMKEKISTNKILASISLVFGILSLFSLCFTFTVQIMHRIPILMSYFGDHYARLLVS